MNGVQDMHIFDSQFAEEQKLNIDVINDKIQSIDENQFIEDLYGDTPISSSSSPNIKEVANKFKNYFTNILNK